MNIIDDEMKQDVELVAKLHGLDKAIEELEKKKTTICRELMAGNISLDDAVRQAFEPYNMSSVMRTMRWSLSPSTPAVIERYDFASPDRYREMAADYERFLVGAPLSDSPWLFEWEGDLEHNYYLTPYATVECVGPVSPAGKASFFRLCAAALVPIETFLCPPASIPIPKYCSFSGGDMIHFEIVADASPLLLADDPVGEEFSLPLEGGGAIHIKVVSAEPKYDILSDDEKHLMCIDWECRGRIENYTGAAMRKITFTTWDNELRILCAENLGDEDMQAFLDSWRDFIEWKDDNQAKVEEACMAMLEESCRSLEESLDALARPLQSKCSSASCIDNDGCRYNAEGYNVELLLRQERLLHISYDALFSDINVPRAYCCALVHACGTKWPGYDDEAPWSLDPYWEPARRAVGRTFPKGLVGDCDPLSQVLPPREGLRCLIKGLVRKTDEPVVNDMAYRFGITDLPVDEVRLAEALSDALFNVIANPPDKGDPSWMVADDWALVDVKYQQLKSADSASEA